MAKKKIQVGQKVRFDPFETACGYGVEAIRGMVTGTVIEVYENHKWFAVGFGEPMQRISFKFCDVGERVKLVG